MEDRTFVLFDIAKRHGLDSCDERAIEAFLVEKFHQLTADEQGDLISADLHLWREERRKKQRRE